MDSRKLAKTMAKVCGQDPIPYGVVSYLVGLVHGRCVKQATKYLSPKLTIKATRQGKTRKGERQMTILVSIGRPNYTEREFIKQAVKAGEPFPVNKVLVKYDKKTLAAGA